MSHPQHSNVYDNHTLFIKCETASAKQIAEAFHHALRDIQTEMKMKIDCRFRVNLVENREGVSFGIAFVFVTNTAIYHMLIGKNPDGSDRIEYRDDPSWTEPNDNDEVDVVNDSGWSTISTPIFTSGMSWAQTMEEEEEYENKIRAEKDKRVCPKIAIPLEPLMRLPPYKLTKEQIEAKRAKIIADNEGKPDFNVSLVQVPETAYFNVDRAMVSPVDPKFMPNILKCRDLPDWITKDDLKVEFAPYASDSKTVQERSVKGRRVEETYPFVNINDDKVGFIIFDPNTYDAQFALHMMKKTIIRKKMQDKTEKVATLIFNHSYRTDRDVMADINQRPKPIQRTAGKPLNEHRGSQRQIYNSPKDTNKQTNTKPQQVCQTRNTFSALNLSDE